MNNEFKTVCNKCYQKTYYEEEQQCHYTIFKGCKTCGSYQNINKQKKCTGTLKVIDNSNLSERARAYYERGERVKITYKDGSFVRCYIGKSTGWKPVYLEILKRNSLGGSKLYLPDDAKIEGLGIYK
jgi:hypothetical protein